MIDNVESEMFWQAIRRRDARFNGVFVFGVRTTGIFCKPSCSARAAKRENVVFFHAPGEAEADGFRACLRCRPALDRGADPQIKMILRACEMLGLADPVTLGNIALQLGMSTSHFQRTFTNIVGISPKKYAEAKRMERFKDELRSGSDVVTAMYDAGFGSSSRLYEKAADKLGMTPAVYKKGGKGMSISYVIAECELGLLLVARTPRGICSVTFGDSREQLAEDLYKEFPNATVAEDAEDLSQAVASIINYLSGKQKRLILPLDLQATAFQLQVWEVLKEIPYGETRSYSQIAEKLGDKNKVRAVAQACARNRVAVVIPCHRVVGSDGSITGYRWGAERKKKLLAKEKTA